MLIKPSFPCTFSILTEKMIAKAKREKVILSIRKFGYHFLINSQAELTKLETEYKKGGLYNKEKIFTTDINDKKFGGF